MVDSSSASSESGPWPATPGQPTGSSLRLLKLAQAGNRDAMDALFARYLPRMHRWARGRLPRWTRSITDTTDLIHDVIVQTIPRLSDFQPQHQDALRAYLRLAVDNRIRDERRRAMRRPIMEALDDALPPADRGPSPFRQLKVDEDWQRYRRALDSLSTTDRRLIVGRAELGYSFKQLALLCEKNSADAARVAFNRAVVKLAAAMADGA